MDRDGSIVSGKGLQDFKLQLPFMSDIEEDQYYKSFTDLYLRVFKTQVLSNFLCLFSLLNADERLRFELLRQVI